MELNADKRYAKKAFMIMMKDTHCIVRVSPSKKKKSLSYTFNLFRIQKHKLSYESVKKTVQLMHFKMSFFLPVSCFKIVVRSICILFSSENRTSFLQNQTSIGQHKTLYMKNFLNVMNHCRS